MYLSLYCKDSKRLFKVCVWEGVWDRTETAIFWPLLLWPSTLCLSRSPDAQPEAQRPTLLGDGFLYCILSASSLDPNSSGPQAPSAWCGFPYHNSTPTGTRTIQTSVLTELYNSSTGTQSPTRSLKSHVWSSSSGNKCHAIHSSLSFFTSSHFISQFPPTRFPLITAIRMCHLFPVHHFGMAFLAGSKGQNTTPIFSSKFSLPRRLGLSNSPSSSLQRRKFTHQQKPTMSWHDITQPDGKDLALEIWGIWSTPSLPLLPDHSYPEGYHLIGFYLWLK